MLALFLVVPVLLPSWLPNILKMKRHPAPDQQDEEEEQLAEYIATMAYRHTLANEALQVANLQRARHEMGLTERQGQGREDENEGMVIGRVGGAASC